MTRRMVIAIATLAVGVAVLGFGLHLRGTAVRARAWPTTPGRILERGVARRKDTENYFYPRVRYAYTVAGKDYTGERVYQTGRVDERPEAKVRSMVDALPDPIPVHYDPSDPHEAFLLANPSWTYWIAIAFGMGALLVGAVQLLGLLAKRTP